MRTDTSTPVLTGDLGTTAELTLVPLAQPEALAETPAAAPVGTWTLADLGGERAAEKVDTYLALTAGEATGRGGCNNFRGSYTLDGEVLRFGPVAATRRLCPPPQMQQETGFFAALEATRGFRIEDGRLILLGEAGAPLASLKRQE